MTSPELKSMFKELDIFLDLYPSPTAGTLSEA